MIKVKVSRMGINRRLRALPSKKEANKAASRAINRSITAAKKVAGREVAKDYFLLPSKVNKGFSASKSVASNISASMRWKSPQLSLSEFKTSPANPPSKRTRRKLRTAIMRGALTKYDGAFLNVARSNGKKLVLKRKGKARYKTTGLLGPSPAMLVRAAKVKKRFINRFNEMLLKRLEHEANYIQSKKASK